MGGRGIKRKSFYLLPLKIPFSAHWETSEEDAWGEREEEPYFIWSTSWSDETGKWGDFALNQAFLHLLLVSHCSPSPSHLVERKSAFPGVTGAFSISTPSIPLQREQLSNCVHSPLHLAQCTLGIWRTPAEFFLFLANLGPYRPNRPVGLGGCALGEARGFQANPMAKREMRRLFLQGLGGS